jgi:hypothetical protein
MPLAGVVSDRSSSKAADSSFCLFLTDATPFEENIVNNWMSIFPTADKIQRREHNLNFFRRPTKSPDSEVDFSDASQK